VTKRLSTNGSCPEPENATNEDKVFLQQNMTTLTNEEREAIAYYVGTGGPDMVDATLRSLLERLA